MEWVYVAGSVASIVAVVGVLLGLARRQAKLTEKAFRELFGVLVAISMVGMGIVAMTFSRSSVMENIGATVTVIGAVLLFIILIMVVYSAQQK